MKNFINKLIIFFILFVIIYKINKSCENFAPVKRKNVLVLYVFHQYNERVKYFIENNIFEDKNVKFMIICNDKYFNIPNYIPSHVTIIKRENVGYDFGGWSEGLLKNNNYKNFDYFLFINSYVMGPYLNKDEKRNYVDIYLDGLKNNVKLFGSTINTIENPIIRSHIQSYIFSTDKEGLEHLINAKIFSLNNHAKTFQNAIDHKEVKMSREILNKGWNIGCLHKYYKDFDFRVDSLKKSKRSVKYASRFGDVMEKEYEEKLWNKNDLVFVKGNRLNLSKV